MRIREHWWDLLRALRISTRGNSIYGRKLDRQMECDQLADGVFLKVLDAANGEYYLTLRADKENGEYARCFIDATKILRSKEQYGVRIEYPVDRKIQETGIGKRPPLLFAALMGFGQQGWAATPAGIPDECAAFKKRLSQYGGEYSNLCGCSLKLTNLPDLLPKGCLIIAESQDRPLFVHFKAR